jgi:sulfate transport system substrate-binding protein
MIVKPTVLRHRLRVALPVLAGGLLALYALWPWMPVPGRAAPTRTIVFYGFSILGEVMNEAIFPAFQEHWHARTGERVEFISSFSASGTVTNQVIMGVPAGLVMLSLELDAERLSTAGVVPPQSWRQLPHGGVLNRTPFVIVVRPGNPRGIKGFADLAKPGVKVIHPDPLTSGGANWAIVAEYGAGARRVGGQAGQNSQSEQARRAGHEVLLGVWRNVAAQAASARAARTQFDNGFGDALITYEQEPLSDQSRGKLKGEIVYPASTVFSEHTLVVVDRNVRPQDREVVGAFAAFLWSEPAQRLFIKYGFRSVDDALNGANPAFGAIADPFLIDAFGGWKAAKREIVDGVWKQQVLEEIRQ